MESKKYKHFKNEKTKKKNTRIRKNRLKIDKYKKKNEEQNNNEKQIIENNEDRTRNKNKKKNKNITIQLIQIILIIIMIYSGIEIIKWYRENNLSKEMKNKIEQTVTVKEDINENEALNGDNYEIDFKELKNINPDTVGWLKVNNTNIEYPIVKSKDNEYYLEHSLDKTNNTAGWPFADYKNKIDGTDKNIVIYGHNRRDQSMFGSLKNVLEENWYNNEINKNIVFITENQKATYEIFSIYQVQDEDYYITTNFKEDEFKTFIEKIKSRSIKNFNVEVDENDQILTLSTCAANNKYRTVVHAKKIEVN